jgi:hypothetical protein
VPLVAINWSSLLSFTTILLVPVHVAPLVEARDVSFSCWPIPTIGASFSSVLNANLSDGGGFCEGQPWVELLGASSRMIGCCNRGMLLLN